MDDRLERSRHRREFSKLGWTLLIYSLLMNACVILFLVFDMVMVNIGKMNGIHYTEEQVTHLLMNNGWGYLVTIAIGLLILRLWQGKRFVRETLWTRGRPMKPGDFFNLLALTLGVQLVFSILVSLMEALFNLFGMSLMDSVESATMSADSFSMFLYMGVGAPVAEEILFRGLILRKLQPYGKRFAIVMSALVFGVFHGNLVQIPYAFLVGLVLGYTALEHNILWAMVLHMFNNLVLADMLTRLTSGLPEFVGNGIVGLVIMACGLASLVILIVRGREIGAYRRENRIRGDFAATFFSAPGIITMMVYIFLSVAAPLVGQVFEKFAK